MNLTASTVRIPQRADALARVQAGESVCVAGRHGKTTLLLQLADALEGAVVVRVPASPDQVPYVLLHLAAALGTEVLAGVAACLSRRADEPAEALGMLARALGSRPLLVDDVDAIGVRGIDPELRPALKPASSALRKWLGQHARVRTFSEHHAELDVRPEPEVDDDLATWERVDHDVDAFGLALLRARLADVDDVDAELSWDPRELVAEVWSALPEPLQELVARLAVHGRPIARVEWEALGLDAPGALTDAIEVGLVDAGGGLIWLPKPWYAHCPAVSGRHRAATLHGELARAFAGQVLGKDAYLVKPLFALEAHRHFAAVPDLERAREFARFGGATLLETARRLSLAGRSEPTLFAEAARTYDVVLQLDEENRSAGGGLGRETVAYARHYRHYNRYRAGLESRAETIDGYGRAVEAWPQNALFWSRYIVSLFADDRYTDASGAMAKAYDRVPHHANRDRVLRARTTERLLRRELVDAALLAWGDYRCGLLEQSTERRLHSELTRGFSTDRLRGRGETVVFREPQNVRFARTSSAWIARALDEAGHGEHPAAAYEDLRTRLRTEAERLHRTLTHQLDASDRMRKQTLLGVIDLAASRMLRLEGTTTWVFGRLTEGWGALVFKTDDDTEFALDLPNRPPLTAEASYRFARVKTGEAGEPVGPVVELEAPLGTDPAVVWERWKKRIAGDG